MSDTDPDAEAEDPPDREAEPGAESNDGDQPDLDAEETANLSGLDLDGDSLDPNADEGKGDTTDTTDGEDSSGEIETDGESVDVSAGEWGDMYVTLLTQTTNSIIDKHGDGYDVSEDHFRQIDLDEHFNATLEKYSRDSNMEPEQALVVGSLVATAGPIVLHTDLLDQLGDEIDV